MGCACEAQHASPCILTGLLQPPSKAMPVNMDNDIIKPWGSGSARLSRRQVIGGAMAGVAVTALGGCDGASVSADRDVDVVLIGGGIMTATLGALLRQLEPDWSMELFERRDRVALESTNAWHNAGTGHSALCELNYTPVDENGNIEIERALQINEDFQVSRQLWASMVRRGVLSEPSSFINTTPHMSFVMQEDFIEFLRQRYDVLRVHPLFAGMQFSTDHEQIRQ
jgi:malate dehydrogenase (quinone)